MWSRSARVHGLNTHVGLKISCPDCGAHNFVAINSAPCSYTLYCNACGAEVRLFMRRSRPASFAPPSAISTTGEERSGKYVSRREEEAVAMAA